MALPFVVDTYRLAAPHIEAGEAETVVGAALEAAREKHPDLERFLPAMDFLSTVIFTDHRNIPLADFLEVLYCAAKHADFARPWRAQLREQKRSADTPGPATVQ